MLLEVLVHAKLREQRKCYPDSTHECRAKPLVSESNKESTVHKQWGVKKHFSQVLVADILKERKIQSCSQAFINIFYYNFFKVKCILFSAGSALQTEEGNTPLLLPEGSGCDCCNPANKQGRSHTALSIWGLEMSHSKKIPKGIHPRSFFCFCNFQTLFQAIYWSMKDTASCCGIGGHSSNRPPFTARAMVGVWLDFPLSYCYFIFFVTFFYSWYLLKHLKFLLKDMESKGTLYYLRKKGTYGTSNILAYAKMTP